MLNEIQNKAFDEESDKSGGLIRCGESGVLCTVMSSLGADGSEARATYDDVDDYDGLSIGAIYGNNIQNSQGNSLGTLYQGYSLVVSVCNDSDYNGSCVRDGDSDDDNFTAKLITVTITTPMDFPITFATYRSNF
jgi:MSHA pilin protein MshD